VVDCSRRHGAGLSLLSLSDGREAPVKPPSGYAVEGTCAAMAKLRSEGKARQRGREEDGGCKGATVAVPGRVWRCRDR
jgi:hypothetical protein